MKNATNISDNLLYPGVHLDFDIGTTSWIIDPEQNALPGTDWEVVFTDANECYFTYHGEIELDALFIKAKTAFFSGFRQTDSRGIFHQLLPTAGVEILHEVSSVPFPTITNKASGKIQQFNGFLVNATSTNPGTIDLEHILFRKYQAYGSNTTFLAESMDLLSQSVMAGTASYAGDKLYYRCLVYIGDLVPTAPNAVFRIFPGVIQYTGVAVEEDELPYVMNMLRSMDVNTDAQ